MKMLAGFLCALLVAIVGMTTDANAYVLTNNTPVVITGISVRTSCGVFGPYTLGPASSSSSSINVPIPSSCTIFGIMFRGAFFPVGYNGPVPPPNPPNGLTVGAAGATFW